MTDGWIMDEFGDGSDLPAWFGHACTGCGEFVDDKGAKPWKMGEDRWAHPWCFMYVGQKSPTTPEADR